MGRPSRVRLVVLALQRPQAALVGCCHAIVSSSPRGC
jgi:hypothetical protein